MYRDDYIVGINEPWPNIGVTNVFVAYDSDDNDHPNPPEGHLLLEGGPPDSLLLVGGGYLNLA